jgi:hypothetical protein
MFPIGSPGSIAAAVYKYQMSAATVTANKKEGSCKVLDRARAEAVSIEISPEAKALYLEMKMSEEKKAE